MWCLYKLVLISVPDNITCSIEQIDGNDNVRSCFQQSKWLKTGHKSGQIAGSSNKLCKSPPKSYAYIYWIKLSLIFLQTTGKPNYSTIIYEAFKCPGLNNQKVVQIFTDYWSTDQIPIKSPNASGVRKFTITHHLVTLDLPSCLAAVEVAAAGPVAERSPIRGARRRKMKKTLRRRRRSKVEEMWEDTGSFGSALQTGSSGKIWKRKSSETTFFPKNTTNSYKLHFRSLKTRRNSQRWEHWRDPTYNIQLLIYSGSSNTEMYLPNRKALIKFVCQVISQ